MQQPIVTEQQQKALEKSFQKIKADYVQLPPYVIFARMMSIEGIDCNRAMKGYQLMRQLGVIPDSFISGGTEIEKKILKTLFHPVMCEMITTFGLAIEEFDLKFKNPKTGEIFAVNKNSSPEEIKQFEEDYRNTNKVGIGDDANTPRAIDNRTKARSLGLSLDNDAPGYGKHEHNESDSIANVKDKITKTILGLDVNF